MKVHINKVLAFEYTLLPYFTGIIGFCVCNAYETVIKNVHINTQQPTVFSIMKFAQDFDDLYHDVIVPVCHECGFQAVRGDECFTASTILQDIIREISQASVIIADVTMDNPNVFYELGYAHALGKPTILLADSEKRERLPFDISGYRTVFYSNTIGGKKEVERTLRKYIENISQGATG